MAPTLFSFIRKYSRRQQNGLLLFTLLSFPFLHVSVGPAKIILNDAIGSVTSTIKVLGFTLARIPYPTLLCGLFPTAVPVGGTTGSGHG